MKKSEQPVSIVSPIYNDLETMPGVLPALEKRLSARFTHWEILLIDDDSHDGSTQWISHYSTRKKRIRLLIHRKNQGIAATYRELYDKARYDVVVLFSLDGEWNPEDAIRLADTLIRDNLDVVVGVRKRKSYTIWRNIVSASYNNITRLFFGFGTQDAGSIKAMTKDVISHVPIISKGVFDEAERIIRAHAMGYRIGFVRVVHHSIKKTKSSIGIEHVLGAIVDCIRVAIDMRFGKLV